MLLAETAEAGPTTRPAGLPFGAIALAAALPVLFLHAAFQPTAHVHLGRLGVSLRVTDVMLGLIVIGAAADARRGVSVLRGGLVVWIAAAVFLADVFAATVYPVALGHSYPWRTHVVTAAKYTEYAVIGLAVPLGVRRASELRVVLWSLVLVGAAATVVALFQFSGVAIFRAWPSGGRQPSFVGVDDYGMLSAAVFVVAAIVVGLGASARGDGALASVGGIAGGIGMVLSGALASVLGMLIAVGVLALVARRRRVLEPRRAVTLLAMTVVVLGGSFFMRSSALGNFAGFLGLGGRAQSTRVESYSHRWVLDYVGLKIFERHPVLGAGWQAGFDHAAYGPVLAAAHRRFPSQPPLAFPSPAHPWGIQNAYVEALAELGLVGAALFVFWISSGLAAGARGALAASPGLSPPLVGLLFICVAIGVWNGLWFIAGIPFDALIWLGFGLAATPPGST